MSSKTHLKQLFRSSIRRGTGEAHLLINQHPDIDFSGEIVKACIKNYAYDGQCESSRATYLFELILLSHKKEKIRSKILSALAIEYKNTWSLTQLFDLAKLFALQGDNEAKQSIYDRFYNNSINGADWAGYTEIIDLGGLDGLLFIAEKIGKNLKNDPDNWQDETMISYFQEKNPEADPIQILTQAGIKKPDIKRYLSNVLQTKENSNYVRDTPVYKDIIDEILLSKRRFVKRNLNEEQLMILAQRLLIEKNEENKQKLLAVFTKFKFPLNWKFILNLATQKQKANKKIVDLAISALRFFSNKEIRKFALAGVNNSKSPEDLLRILKSNYKKGDEKLLTIFAKKSQKRI